MVIGRPPSADLLPEPLEPVREFRPAVPSVGQLCDDQCERLRLPAQPQQLPLAAGVAEDHVVPGPGEDRAELPTHQPRAQDADAHTIPPDQPRYCSSLTCSIHSAVLPSSCSWMAMCVMAVVGAAPCQ